MSFSDGSSSVVPLRPNPREYTTPSEHPITLPSYSPLGCKSIRAGQA